MRRIGHELCYDWFMAEFRKYIKHGATNHPLYPIWKSMHYRCENPKARKYPNYGGRGIFVSPRWNDFWVFAKDVGERPSPRHTLDRIDNDGGYGPGNCRWATYEEQNQNRRVLGVHLTKKTLKWRASVTIRGKRHYIGEYETKEEAIEKRSEYVGRNR